MGAWFRKEQKNDENPNCEFDPDTDRDSFGAVITGER
jgi:hypothetical protein